MHICTRTLIKNEMRKGTSASKVIKQCVAEGTMVPDQYVQQIIEDRLKQTDCKVNGWIMDNYPVTETQIMHLRRIKIKPTLVCLFEQADNVSLDRLIHRRIDPETGDHFNIAINPPEDPAILKRLITLNKDKEEVIRARIDTWNTSAPRVEEAYKKVILNIQTDTNEENITELIADAI